jgi:hypothetical protein
VADRSRLLAIAVAVCALAASLVACGPTDPIGARYECRELLTAELSPDGLPGFPVEISSRNHVRDPNTVIRYASCPPTSGDHYNIANRGPIRPGIYSPSEEQAPGGWVHNLEHGYVVVVYRCPSGEAGVGECITEDEADQLGDFFDQVPDSINPSCPDKVIVARFDTMTTRFAVLAWGRALLTDTFDVGDALLFTEQWQDGETVPERGAC